MGIGMSDDYPEPQHPDGSNATDYVNSEHQAVADAGKSSYYLPERTAMGNRTGGDTLSEGLVRKASEIRSRK